MFIPYPGWLTLILIYIHSESQITDPGSNNNKRGGEILLPYLCCSQKFKKIVNYFILEQVRYSKKIDLIDKVSKYVLTKTLHYALRNMG